MQRLATAAVTIWLTACFHMLKTRDLPVEGDITRGQLVASSLPETRSVLRRRAFFSRAGAIKRGAGDVEGCGEKVVEEKNEGITVLHIGWYLRPFISEFITASLG